MSNILEALKQGKTVESNTRIKLPVEGKAEIFGFVPYHDDFDTCFGYDETITCPPIGAANIIGDRIIFPVNGKFYRAPIFESIHLADEKYPVYLLYVPRFLNLTSKYQISGYKKAFASETPRLIGYDKYPDSIRVIDGVPVYFSEEREYIFSSASKLRGIGNAFVVIVRRRSNETGTVVYEVYNPNEITIIEE